MDAKFREAIKELEAAHKSLVSQQTRKIWEIKHKETVSGVYLLSERGRDLYVGRSRDVRSRLTTQAAGSSFAVKVARIKAKRPATYSKKDSFNELIKNRTFKKEYQKAIERIKRMDVRFVEEKDDTKQCLLEIYSSIVLGTTYNDFKTS